MQLRHQRANLLGYPSHAAFVLEERMAKDEANVRAFLTDLQEKAAPKAKAEWEEIAAYGAQHFNYDNIAKWDTAYLAEKIKQERFAFNEELKPYFALPKVIDGLFEVVQRLFGLTFLERKDIPVYHDDVLAYEVQKEGKFHAVLYMISTQEQGKRNGAWMTSYRSQVQENVHMYLLFVIFHPNSRATCLVDFQ